MDVFLILLVIVALLSMIVFNQGITPAGISTPEVNPLEWFFQVHLGWSLEFGFMFCFTSLALVFLVVWGYGKWMGYYTKRPNDQTLDGMYHNYSAGRLADMNFMAVCVAIGVPVLLLIAWLIGEFYGR
jgi:hypothetical protein